VTIVESKQRRKGMRNGFLHLSRGDVKEEDILSRDLERKPLSLEHKKIMGELVEKHVAARKMVRRLAAAGREGRSGLCSPESRTNDSLSPHDPLAPQKERRIPCLKQSQMVFGLYMMT